jgi:hypothetical protein
MKLRRSTKIALVVAALLASSPSFGQAPLIQAIPRIIYIVISLGGGTLLATTNKAEAKKKKQEHPGAEIEEISGAEAAAYCYAYGLC